MNRTADETLLLVYVLKLPARAVSVFDGEPSAEHVAHLAGNIGWNPESVRSRLLSLFARGELARMPVDVGSGIVSPEWWELAPSSNPGARAGGG